MVPDHFVNNKEILVQQPHHRKNTLRSIGLQGNEMTAVPLRLTVPCNHGELSRPLRRLPPALLDRIVTLDEFWKPCAQFKGKVTFGAANF